MQTHSYDLVVIGGGPAGICGANTAGIFGKRVALVEKLREVGGAGINTGTIPSKTLRETALALSGLGLWPTIALHLAFAFWCMACLGSKHSASRRTI